MYELSAECPSQVTITYYDMQTAQTDCKALEPYYVNTEHVLGHNSNSISLGGTVAEGFASLRPLLS